MEKIELRCKYRVKGGIRDRLILTITKKTKQDEFWKSIAKFTASLGKENKKPVQFKLVNKDFVMLLAAQPTMPEKVRAWRLIESYFQEGVYHEQ